MNKPLRILGIDPGSRITGFGIIDVVGREHFYVASGCIKTIPGDVKMLAPDNVDDAEAGDAAAGVYT